jgi:hypothetical protein
MCWGVHAASATWGAAKARGVVFAVEEAVVVGEFFASFDVAQGNYPHSSRDDVGFAIGFARMIDERSDAVAVDDMLSAVEPEKVRRGNVIVKVVGLFVGQALANVFNYESALADQQSGIATAGVDARFSKDQGHGAYLSLAHRGGVGARGVWHRASPRELCSCSASFTINST